ncbi:MAG TPA: hypothetical protein ENJ68_07095, partial [Devosia sp.]|nr:hypothetical protein [Devosia sp.]
MIIFDIAGQPVTLGMGLVWALVGLLLGGASVLLLVQRQGKRIVLAETERKNLEANLAAREQLLADMREETAALRRTSEERAQKIAALSARLDEQSRHNAHVQNQMEERFRLLASDVLKSHGETFSRQNREQVENLLKPLREKIGEFQRQSHEGAARLAEQIGQLTQNSLRMSKEATDLTRA